MCGPSKAPPDRLQSRRKLRSSGRAAKKEQKLATRDFRCVSGEHAEVYPHMSQIHPDVRGLGG